MRIQRMKSKMPHFLSPVTRLTRQRGKRDTNDLFSILSEISALLERQEKAHSAELLKLLKDIRWEMQQIRKSDAITRSILAKPVLNELEEFSVERQMNFRDTLHAISEPHVSFARFGDGELKLMLREGYNLRFQKNSDSLRRDLHATLRSAGETPKLLIGFPHPYTDLHWTEVWIDLWEELNLLIPSAANFGNSHVSRPIVFQRLGWEAVDLWRSVWNRQKACVITGAGSRFKRRPELFDNVSAWREIDSLPINAHADLDRIMTEVNRDSDSSIFLIALGPAGTILAKHISETGRKAIDLGHLSDSFENVFENGLWPEAKDVV